MPESLIFLGGMSIFFDIIGRGRLGELSANFVRIPRGGEWETAFGGS